MARILMVDDSSTDTYLYQKLLEQNGYQVITATSGKEGVLKAKSEKPDLILMDVVMPELNGFQATRQISRDPTTAGIPVIMVTNKGQESDKVWGLRQGAKDYFTKGSAEQELLGKIQALVNA